MGSVWTAITSGNSSTTPITISGPSYVIGNLSVSSIVIDGADNATLNVSGCVDTSNLNVTLSLTQSDIESLESSGGRTHVLIIQGGSCQSNLSSVAVSLSQASDCRVASSRPSALSNVLSVFVSVNSSACGTSSIWWIILVAELGGVILVVLVVVLLNGRIPQLRSRLLPALTSGDRTK